MKRVFLLIFSIIFLFCSCNKKDVKSSVCLNLSSLNTAFSLYVDDIEFKGNLKYENDNMCFVLNYPENIKGMTFEVSQNKAAMIYDNVKSSEISSPENIFISFYNCINDLKKAPALTLKNSMYEYNGKAYYAKLNEKGDLLSIQSLNYKFIF